MIKIKKLANALNSMVVLSGSLLASDEWEEKSERRNVRNNGSRRAKTSKDWTRIVPMNAPQLLRGEELRFVRANC